jgi:cellulose synthase/poly-beta-1,6-N-acetylglucosamine synthase-like glycosyltransferase
METRYSYGKLRYLEMFPGLLVWGTFVVAFILSFAKPFWVIIFIIIFDLLWLFRVAYFNLFILIAWRKYKKALKVDWHSKLHALKKSKSVLHLVFLPTYKEEYEVIDSTFASLKENTYHNDKMVIVLGGEEGDKEHFEGIAQKIQEKYGRVFSKVVTTVHPRGLPGERPGKGSNLAWMASKVQTVLSEDYSQYKDEDIIVSAFDVDTIAHKQYFSYLTYLYCTVENPTKSSYQPIALFSNNIWSASAPVRVGAFGTTFWLFGELARPERLWTFSSHSMPWKMLKDVGFWQKDIVSEDSRIFMQAFLHYHGDYRVTPMFLPVSMDAVTGKTYRQSLGALYQQMLRWAWGVEHLPYLVEGFRRDKLIPWKTKFKYIFNHIEGMHTWATAPIIMFVLGYLPLYIAAGRSNALIQAAPFTLQQLMQLAMIGILVSATVSLTLLPRRPKEVKGSTWLVMIFQWALLPITFIVFGSFPAIDAQTRLMFGRYLGFKVTKKIRK